MTQKTQLATFIICFQLSDVPASIAISMAVWQIFQVFDSGLFTLLTLATLLVSSFLMKCFSYLIDCYSKNIIIQWLNIAMGLLVFLTLFIDSPWLYLLLYGTCSLYFQIFYTVYNAMAQTLPFDSKHIVSATLEMTGKMVNLFVSGVIWLLFEPLGMHCLLSMCVVLFFLASWASATYEMPKQAVKKNLKNSKKTQIKGLSWYFSQPIAWLVTLAMLPNIVVLLSNTINPVYLYQVQGVSAETLAQISMAFSFGSLLGAVAVFKLSDEKKVIYISFFACVLLSASLALFPVFSVFVVSMAIFGFANSASRVMFRLVIMKNIADHKAGRFYGLRSSLVSGVQFITLLSMNGALELFSPKVSVWFYPALFLIVPFLWAMSKFYNDNNVKNL